jgi:Ca-activated chloride channel homolog
LSGIETRFETFEELLRLNQDPPPPQPKPPHRTAPEIFNMSVWSSRSNKSLAVIAMTLSVGGLVLMRAPKGATAGNPVVVDSTMPNGKNSASFSGPGLRGELALSHSHVLSNPGFQVYGDMTLKADASQEKVRAPLSLAVVLDISGSMSGEKIEEGKRSIVRMIADMQDNDEIALVTYSNDANLVQPLRRLGDIRSALVERVRSLGPEGGTNIPSGLRVGRQALAEAGKGRVKRVVLVSDGLDSTRAEAERLAGESAENGVVVSSLGIGLDFDEMYMSSVASKGHGNFAFVKDGAALAAFLGKELKETANTVVENTKIKLTLPEGVHFVRASGANTTLVGNELTLSVGALYSGEERRVFLEFNTDLAKGSSSTVMTHASWDKVGGSHAEVSASALALAASDDARAVTASIDPIVNARAVTVVASRRQTEAAEAFARGDLGRAQGLIAQNQVELKAAASAAPAAMAAPMARQAAAYESDGLSYARGGSGAKAAAKSAVAREHVYSKDGKF